VFQINQKGEQGQLEKAMQLATGSFCWIQQDGTTNYDCSTAIICSSAAAKLEIYQCQYFNNFWMCNDILQVSTNFESIDLANNALTALPTIKWEVARVLVDDEGYNPLLEVHYRDEKPYVSRACTVCNETHSFPLVDIDMVKMSQKMCTTCMPTENKMEIELG